MGGLSLRGIAKRYGPVEVMRDLSLDIAAGEFEVFLGPSGCGKSTLLRMVAGLESLSEGEIHLADRRIDQLPPGERRVAMLSFDEWNVWYRTRRRTANRTRPGWPVAPPILEEVYDMQDALAFGGACISLLNHADRVRAASLAQLVNVIAPIMTETGGGAWRQTMFWPFAHMSNHGRGRVLRAVVESETYETAYFDPRGPNDPPIPLPAAPYLKLAAVLTGEGGVSIFALNRDLAQPLELRAEMRGLGGLRVLDAQTMHDGDLKATNTRDYPDWIRPTPLDGVRTDGGTLAVELPAASWTVIRLVTA